MLRILLVIAFIFQITCAYTQNKQLIVGGVIVTGAGDRIKGQVLDVGDRKLMKNIRFKAENAADFEILDPDEVVEVELTNGVVFVSRNINGRNTFVKHVFDGQFDLYELWANPPRYFISRGIDDFQELIIDTITVVRGIQKDHRLELRYLSILKDFMQACPQELKEKNRIDRRHLLKQAEAFHECIDQPYSINNRPTSHYIGGLAGGFNLWDGHKIIKAGVWYEFNDPNFAKRSNLILGLTYASTTFLYDDDYYFRSVVLSVRGLFHFREGFLAPYFSGGVTAGIRSRRNGTYIETLIFTPILHLSVGTDLNVSESSIIRFDIGGSPASFAPALGFVRKIR